MNPLNELLELAQQREDLDAKVVAAVAAARADGASWQAIANKLGGTKQAAQQRYGRRIEDLPLSDPIFDPLFHTPQVHSEPDQLDEETATDLDAAPATPPMAGGASKVGATPALESMSWGDYEYEWQNPAPRRTAAAPADIDLDDEATHNRIEAGELDTAGATIDWTGQGAPTCRYCRKTHHYEGKGRNRYFWIYPGCNPTHRDRQFAPKG